jgi:capsid protein
MNPLRHWKVAFCLLATVVVSGLAGGLLGHRVARRQIEARNDPENWNDHVAREFERVVKPTAEQGAKIQTHLDRAVRELQGIRLETIARSTNVIWRLVAEVEKELEPEQRKAFENLKPKPDELSLDVLNVTPQSSPVPTPKR